MKTPIKLQFRNENFTILHITDTQEIPAVSPDTTKLYDTLLERTQPDLVVLTGDQIKGHSGKFKRKNQNTETLIEQTIVQMLKPITDRNIPFAVTFGNHDRQAGISNATQMDMYRKLPGFAGEVMTHAPGTYVLPIYNTAGDKPAFLVYLLDSGTDAKEGGYQPLSTDSIQWYKNVRDTFAKENDGKVLPSIIFQHIPLPEYYDVLQQVPRKTKGAIRTFRTHANEYYILPDTAGKSTNDFFLEAPSTSDINTHAFEAFQQKDDVIAVYVGHDHGNSFVREHTGISLGYTQSSGFNEYGPGILRGGRKIQLNESDLSTHKTNTYTYQQLVGNTVSRPLLDALYRIFPTSMDQAKHVLPRYGLYLLAGIGAIVALALLLF